ncbi:MAG: hypothetical protein OER95_01770 [Acidimicrobiia bacterium]|nr:hypothetical protein [Acidimicrobiia bacterium]
MTAAALGLMMVIGTTIARKRKNGGESAAERPTMWDKMRQGMEEMPEDFPPRIMYENVEATRANTERILEYLQEHGGSEQPDENTAKAGV